jgi:hypothetical protein
MSYTVALPFAVLDPKAKPELIFFSLFTMSCIEDSLLPQILLTSVYDFFNILT